MSLPTKDILTCLEFSVDGSPFSQFAPKPGMQLDNLEYSVDGSPFWCRPTEQNITLILFSD
jgi:hypothetical protein